MLRNIAAFIGAKYGCTRLDIMDNMLNRDYLTLMFGCSPIVSAMYIFDDKIISQQHIKNYMAHTKFDRVYHINEHIGLIKK